MSDERIEAEWARHSQQWRDPTQIPTLWESAVVDPQLVRYRTTGTFWETLENLGVTLLVSREYEHLLVGLSVSAGKPHMTHMPIPHPSGIAVDREAPTVSVASTRNPNQVFRFAPVVKLLDRRDMRGASPDDHPLVPVASAFYPGSLYIHDLAYIGKRLYGNAVAHNAVAELRDDGWWRRVWWPKAAERNGHPEHAVNHLQINSIAAGTSLATSYFSASTAVMSARRPGHLNFPVDGRGVIFSGRTREPVVEGLTRPHSARIRGGVLWVANSGYGELVRADNGRLETVAELPGWTRGLCICKGIAFVATSRVIPRFRAYAPGLDVEHSVCGVHAVELETGRRLGSLIWPAGNQIFAVEWIDRAATLGLPFGPTLRRGSESRKMLFYAYETQTGLRGRKRDER